MSSRLRLLSLLLAGGLSLGWTAWALQPVSPQISSVECSVKPLDDVGNLDALYSPFQLTLTAGIEPCIRSDDIERSYSEICRYLDLNYPDYVTEEKQFYAWIFKGNGWILVCFEFMVIQVSNPDGSESALIELNVEM